MTVIGPGVTGLKGAIAVICVGELTVKFEPTPLNSTPRTLLKLVPVITTCIRALSVAGVKFVMVGAGGPIENVPALVPVPSIVVTLIGPGVKGTGGTVAVIWLLESTVNTAGTPLKSTLETAENLVPVM